MVQHRNTKNDPIAAAYALSVVKEPSRPGFRAAMVNLNPALALSLPSVFTVELEANSGSRHVRSQCITARASAESPFTVSGTGVRHAWALSYVASESSLHAAIRPLRSSQLNRRGGSSVPRVRPGWQPQPRDAISQANRTLCLGEQVDRGGRACGNCKPRDIAVPRLQWCAAPDLPPRRPKVEPDFAAGRAAGNHARDAFLIRVAEDGAVRADQDLTGLHRLQQTGRGVRPVAMVAELDKVERPGE